MSKSLLLETLETIRIERTDKRKFTQSFKLVNKLVDEYDENDLATRLYTDIPKETPWEIIADLFSILIWTTSKNGHDLIKKTQEWLLEGNDERKMLVAMNLDVYPFVDRVQMENVLTGISQRFPNLKRKCEELITQRRKDSKIEIIE